MSNINIETARAAITRAVANTLADMEYDGEIYFDANYAEAFPDFGAVTVGLDTDEGLLAFNLRISGLELNGAAL